MALQNAVSERLTERERTCLRLVHAHWSSKQIARELGIKPGTVDKYCERAARKLNTDSRVSAALLLAASDSYPTGSHSEPVPLDRNVGTGPLGAAKEAAHDRRQSAYPIHLLDRRADRPASDGDLGGQTDDGHTSGGRDAQTVPVPDAGRGAGGTVLPGFSAAGLRVQAVGFGHEHLGRIVFVFGIAAVAVLIVTGLAGAERFAFLLQKLRYGG